MRDYDFVFAADYGDGNSKDQSPKAVVAAEENGDDYATGDETVDYSDLSVAEIRAGVSSGKYKAADVYAAEKDGKKRQTILDLYAPDDSK